MWDEGGIMKKCWQQLGKFKLASEARTAVRTNQRGRAVSVKTEQLQGIQNITEDLHKFNAWLILRGGHTGRRDFRGVIIGS